jgi:hypothetical protein
MSSFKKCDGVSVNKAQIKMRDPDTNVILFSQFTFGIHISDG